MAKRPRASAPKVGQNVYLEGTVTRSWENGAVTWVTVRLSVFGTPITFVWKETYEGQEMFDPGLRITDRR